MDVWTANADFLRQLENYTEASDAFVRQVVSEIRERTLCNYGPDVLMRIAAELRLTQQGDEGVPFQREPDEVPF